MGCGCSRQKIIESSRCLRIIGGRRDRGYEKAATSAMLVRVVASLSALGRRSGRKWAAHRITVASPVAKSGVPLATGAQSSPTTCSTTLHLYRQICPFQLVLHSSYYSFQTSTVSDYPESQEKHCSITKPLHSPSFLGKIE